MKYETPRVTALTPAINAIQGLTKPVHPNGEGAGIDYEMLTPAYEDWEE